MRELLADESGTGENPQVVGLVALVGRDAFWAGMAVDVFARIRSKLGDVQAAEALLAEGWSNGNGSLYLSEQATT